jgi:putative membrane protein
MEYNYIKSLHLIFVITWFAGLFYIVRLFVYQIEAQAKESPAREILSDQYKIMTKRLWYIITWPSMVLAVGFAIWLLLLVPSWIEESWMQVKLAFVVALIFYHIKCHLIFKSHFKGAYNYSSNWMRLFNEGATLILFSVVFLVILKKPVDWIYGTVGIVLFSVILMLGFKIYKRSREKS